METGDTQHILSGHTSRIWDCVSSNSNDLIASASGDSTMRLWGSVDGDCRAVFHGDGGDVYGIRWRSNHQVCIVCFGKHVTCLTQAESYHLCVL